MFKSKLNHLIFFIIRNSKWRTTKKLALLEKGPLALFARSNGRQMGVFLCGRSWTTARCRKRKNSSWCRKWTSSENWGTPTSSGTTTGSSTKTSRPSTSSWSIASKATWPSSSSAVKNKKSPFPKKWLGKYSPKWPWLYLNAIEEKTEKFYIETWSQEMSSSMAKAM